MTDIPIDDYIVVQLTSGEMLVGIKTDETDKELFITFPMQISKRVSQEDDGVRQIFTGTPYCPFVDTRTFPLLKNGIIFTKKLHEMLIPHYMKMVEYYEKTVDISATDLYEENSLKYKSLEEIGQVLENLESMLGNREEDEEDTNLIIHDGNDTVH